MYKINHVVLILFYLMKLQLQRRLAQNREAARKSRLRKKVKGQKTPATF